VSGVLIGVTVAKPVADKPLTVTMSKPEENLLVVERVKKSDHPEQKLVPFVPLYMGNWD
jgi:hypothetical protein